LILNLRQFAAEEQPETLVTGYEVSRRLLDMANPDSPQYLAAWGGVMQGVQVNDVMQVDVSLRQPHVLPEALLRVPLEPVTDTDTATGKGDGAFEVTERNETETHYGWKAFQPGGRLAELVERRYDDTQQALAALRRGEIDVIDRVFPADAARLRDELPMSSDIVIGQYALPTIHMLLVNSDNPFLANRDFRRALVFAIDRQRILKQELLGNREIPGCQIISGPFAAGLNERDPLAYAYDLRIEPRGYYPRLAKLLTIIAQDQVGEMAEKRGDPAPELKPLVLGYPAYEAARVACEAIASQMKLIGIEVELKEFPPGVTSDPEGKVDLTYAEVAIWEPLVDARRLLGDDGLAPIDSPYIRRALRQLDESQDWGEVRDRLLELHRTAHDEVAVVPLWQMADSFAYRKSLRNIVGDGPPVWLYQNVDKWRLALPGAAE
jgi:ABC-type transport system substrate-binding protein